MHASRDGVLLAFHDAVLDRVTDQMGPLATLTSEEIGRARIAGAHAVPTMAALLEEFPTVRFNVDLKAEAAVHPLAALIERTAAHGRVCVGSFSPRRMRAFRALTAGRVATSAYAAGGGRGQGGALASPARCCAVRTGRRRCRCPTSAGASPSSRLPSSDVRTPQVFTCTCGPSTSPTRCTTCSTSGSTD